MTMNRVFKRARVILFSSLPLLGDGKLGNWPQATDIKTLRVSRLGSGLMRPGKLTSPSFFIEADAESLVVIGATEPLEAFSQPAGRSGVE